MRIALVVQRYGAEVVGGAEYLTRMIAERLAERHEVEVLASCAKDFRSWANELPEGVRIERGVRVHRFASVTERIRALTTITRPFGAFLKAPGRLWVLGQGPYCPSLVRHLAEEHARYDAIFFFTYLYYPTQAGIRAVPRAAMVPTAHDEAPFHMPHVKDVLRRAKAFLFLTPEEQELVEKKLGGFGDRRTWLLGSGIDVPAEPLDALPKTDVRAPFVLYVGRNKKGVDELPRLWRAFREKANGTKLEADDGRTFDAKDARLVLVGDTTSPHDPSLGVESLGPVDDATKWALLRDALAVVQPSYRESFSLVLPEAWYAGKPTLVNGRCECLDGQTRRSGGGFAYRDEASFAASMLELLRSRATRRDRAKSGQAYAAEHFAWDKVLGRFEECAAWLRDGADEGPGRSAS